MANGMAEKALFLHHFPNGHAAEDPGNPDLHGVPDLCARHEDDKAVDAGDAVPLPAQILDGGLVNLSFFHGRFIGSLATFLIQNINSLGWAAISRSVFNPLRETEFRDNHGVRAHALNRPHP